MYKSFISPILFNNCFFSFFLSYRNKCVCVCVCVCVCIGHNSGRWKFLGQGSNPHHSSNQSHSSDNARFLTCWATINICLSPLLTFQLGFCIVVAELWEFFIYSGFANIICKYFLPLCVGSPFIPLIVSSEAWNFFFFSFFFPFLWPLPRHMEVPTLGVQSAL